MARGLRQAESLAARPGTWNGSILRRRRDLYRQSLAIAADLPDALGGLETHASRPADRARWPGFRRPDPPFVDAPSSRWPRLADFRRRAKGGRLCCSHPGDGTRIAEVSTCEFDDTHATPGESVGYAVLSKRGGVESVTAISLGPFVFLADVKDVRGRAAST